MTRPWPTGIRGRLTVLVMLAVVPLFLLGVGVALFYVLREGREARLMTLTEKPEHIAAQIEHSWSGVQSDVLFLAGVPPISEILRAQANNGVDPVDGASTVHFWLARMAQIFAGMVETKEIYAQIIFVNRDGMEVVRVDLSGGRGVRVPDEQLQNKRDRYYFTETAKLAKGQRYVSPVDLNQDAGKIAVPHQPTVRVATPVFDAAGQFQGIVIVNVLFAEVLKAAIAGHLMESSDAFIADESGYYLYHSANPAKTWGGPRDLNTGEGVKKDFPTDWTTILSGRQSNLKTKGGYVVIQACRLWSENSRFLVVCDVIPDSVLIQTAVATHVLAVLLVSLGLLVGLLGAVVWPLGRSIVGPVSSLLDAVTRFRRGDLHARAPAGRADEIGELTQAFNDMAETIVKKQEGLEAEVRERTAKIQTSRQAALSLLQDVKEQQERAELAVQRLTASEQALACRAAWSEGLQKAGEELAACKTVAEVVQVAARTPVAHLGASMAWVSVPRDGGGMAPLACSSPDVRHDAETCECPVAVYARDQKRIVPDTLADPPYDTCRGAAHAGSARSCDTWPIHAGGNACLGTLTIRSPEKGDDSGVVAAGALLDVFCRQVGYAWERLLAEAEIGRARQAAEAANRAKSAFLANLSHEIRTPMNAILGFSQLLQRDPDSTPGQQQRLDTIMHSGEHLLALINDVLEMSKIEAGRVELHPTAFNLHAMLDDLAMMFRARTDAKGLQFEVNHTADLPRGVTADEGKLRQVLINLLGNAVKFTHKGGIILRVTTAAAETPIATVGPADRRPEEVVQGSSLAVSRAGRQPGAESRPACAGGTDVAGELERADPAPLDEASLQSSVPPDGRERNSGKDAGVEPCPPPPPNTEPRTLNPEHPSPSPALRLCFAVEDTGVGIAADEIGRLFAAFSQTASGVRSQQGTGLGLAISRQYVRLMGGDITVASEPERGSAFRFEVEVAPGEAPDAATPGETRRVVGLVPGQTPCRVLVVDDKPENRIFLVEILKAVGFDTAEARTGEEAIARFEAWQPHAILMDMRMPVMDGYEATRRIKATARGRKTPVIAVTASAFDDERHRATAVGVNAYLSKPVRVADLFTTLARCLPVQYVYAEGPGNGKPATPPASVTPAQVAGLAADIRNRLRAAVASGDGEALLALMTQVEAVDADLAAGLRRLVKGYEYERLLELLGSDG